MHYEPPERRRLATRRSILDSPLLSALLVVVAAGLGAALLLVPGARGPGGPSTTPRVSSAAGTAGAIGQSPVATFVRPTPSPAPTFVSYRVQSGDSLNSIAKKFRTTARSIAWWNRGAYPSLDPEASDYDPNTIRVGWVLVVMPDTVVDDNNPPTPSPGPAAAPS